MQYYRKFPPEIRLKVLKHLLDLQPDKTVPTILIALGSLVKEGAAESKFYFEAQELYRSMNAIIGLKNQKEFQKVKMPELLKIRTIKLVMQPLDLFPSVDLADNKCMLRNNFTTLMFDCSLPRSSWHWISITESLSGASLSGVRKVVAIMSLIVYTNNPVLQRSVPGADERMESIQIADTAMGVKGTRRMLGAKEVWTWEREDGDILDCSLSARGRGRDTGDIGVGTGQGLTRFTSMSRALAMIKGRN